MRVDIGERDDGCLTTDAIAVRIGVTRQRVDQLIAGALVKLRVALQLIELVGVHEAERILERLRGKRPESYLSTLREVRAARAGA